MWLTYFLPTNPEMVGIWEWRLWVGAAGLTVLGVYVGYLAWETGRYKSNLEKAEVERNLEATKSELTTALKQRDVKAQEVERLANETRKMAEELTERQKPRRLSNQQKTRLIQLLSSEKGTIHHFATVAGDGEATGLSNDLIEVLNAAGWKIEGRTLGLMLGGVDVVGVTILVHSQQTAPPSAGVFQAALRGLGLDSPGLTDSKTPSGKFSVIVGRKP